MKCYLLLIQFYTEISAIAKIYHKAVLIQKKALHGENPIYCLLANNTM